MAFVAVDADGRPWYFDVIGAFTIARSGLSRTDAVWKALGRAHVLRNGDHGPVVFLASDLPKRGSEGDVALRAAGPSAFFDALDLRSTGDRDRLAAYAAGGHHRRPLAGFWNEGELPPLGR
jgi:hypothetical protein